MIPADPATEHVFFNAARPTSTMLVEGESDRRFWEMWAAQMCNVRAMGGKKGVLDELEVFRRERLKGRVGVLDADWHYLGRRRVESDCIEDVVMTDAHDLEATLLQSSALDKVLAQYGSRDAIREFCERTETTVRDALLFRARPIGRLRWLSDEHGYGLEFRKVKRDGFAYVSYKDFIDEKVWELDIREMINTVKNFSNRPGLDIPRVEAQIQEADKMDTWQVCNGHDMCGVLAVGLCRVLGSQRSSRRLSEDDIQRALVLAYEREHLRATRMYGQMRAWESRNVPQVLLSD